MFWKRVKFLQNSAITTRLTVFYTLATLLLLVGTALFLYSAMNRAVHAATYQILTDELKILEESLTSQPNNLAALKQEVMEFPQLLHHSVYRYYVRILDGQGQVLMQTPGAEKIFRGRSFVGQSELFIAQDHYGFHTEAGQPYLLKQTTTQGQAQEKNLSIQMAIDVSYQAKTMARYGQELIVALLLGMVAAVLFGYLIARRGLRGLVELTTATQRMTAASLHQRIDPQAWPKELRQLGEAFNAMLARIEHAFLRLVALSADLAHELRTPINNLMGETEIALSQPRTVAEYRQVLTSNLEELHRLAQIIENLLFLAKAENPQLEIKKIPLNVAAEVKVVMEFYAALAEENNITLTQTGDAVLLANTVMFRRMLSNVLANAIKYTPAGGQVTCHIESVAQYSVRITVRDTGIGIAAEHVPKLFDRFYRVDSTRTQQTGGTGLGLAIVKSIVELHQGKVTITSVPNQGTTVIFTFAVVN